MKIAIIQICSVTDPQVNLKKIAHYLEKAVQEGASAAFLPEVFYSMNDGSQVTPYLVQDGNEHFLAIQNLAKKHKIALIGGSAATKVGSQIVNRIYNFDGTGKSLGHYDKIHMFKCLIKKDAKTIDIDESRVYSSGNRLQVIEHDQFKIGLSLCFDLRYPQMYQEYKNQGVHLITASSAFTYETGKEHWHTLVRARAIETQCFIVATNQTGKHNEKLHSYGHSLVVDPWGKVLVDLKSSEGMQVVKLEKKDQKKAQERIIL